MKYLDRQFLLKIFESRMFLLLQVSRTRPGATALLDGNLVQSIRASGIFRTDPDLGLDLDSLSNSYAIGSNSNPTNPNTSITTNTALHTYIILLTSTLRLFLSVFTSIGSDNEKIVAIARSFLAEYRQNMVGIFKRAAGINGKIEEPKTKAMLDECVRCYTGLVVGSGFVGWEDVRDLEGLRGGSSNGNGSFTGAGVSMAGSNGRGFT